MRPACSGARSPAGAMAVAAAAPGAAAVPCAALGFLAQGGRVVVAARSAHCQHDPAAEGIWGVRKEVPCSAQSTCSQTDAEPGARGEGACTPPTAAPPPGGGWGMSPGPPLLGAGARGWLLAASGSPQQPCATAGKKWARQVEARPSCVRWGFVTLRALAGGRAGTQLGRALAAGACCRCGCGPYGGLRLCVRLPPLLVPSWSPPGLVH